MEDLWVRLEQLAARVEVLEAENALLRRRQSGRVPEAPHPTPQVDSGPVGRRGLIGKAVGMAAVGAVGMQLLDTSPAAAATGGNFVLGTGNDAANYTQLTCSDVNSALYVVGQGSSGISYTAAVLGDTDAYNGIAGVTSADPAVGVYGVSGARSGLGYAPAAVFGDSQKYPGVFGESAQDHGVFGQTSANTAAGVYGKGPWIGVQAESPYIGMYANSDGKFGVVAVAAMLAGAAGVTGQVGSDGSGNLASSNTSGVYGLNTGSNGVGYGMQGVHEGSGIGVYGTAWNPKGTGVRGQATTGVRGTGASATGGVGVLGEGNVAVRGNGVTRGGVFKGASAQVQLAAGSGSTHPKAGQRGDLYVDNTGRLWFCKVGGSTATWKQLA